MLIVFFISFLSLSISQEQYCPTEDINLNRSIYSVGDTLSVEDQNMLFPVCNGSGNYSTGDSFSFLDSNGNTNGGYYKITLISMNATW